MEVLSGYQALLDEADPFFPELRLVMKLPQWTPLHSQCVIRDRGSHGGGVDHHRLVDRIARGFAEIPICETCASEWNEEGTHLRCTRCGLDGT